MPGIRPVDITCIYEYKNTCWQSNVCSLSIALVQIDGKCFLPRRETLKTPGGRTSVQQFVSNDGRLVDRSHSADLAYDDSSWRLGPDLRIETFRPLV